ncbi:unnamed protein product [Schistosoma turkestanicum]|nr:unnamed protein product [Schistosoma turkestanicum]
MTNLEKSDTKDLNNSRALNSMENLELIDTLQKTPQSLPNKRPRGRPPSRFKQLENISPVSNSSSSEVLDFVKHSKISESNTNQGSKRTNAKTLNSRSKCLNSPTKTSTPDGGEFIPTGFVNTNNNSNSNNRDINCSLRQRVRTRLVDLFSDSDDDGHNEPSVSSPKLSTTPRKGTLKSPLKLQSPKKPSSSSSVKQKKQHQKQKHHLITTSISNQSLFKSPEFTSLTTADRRRSGWCQTSPELLAVAKAEALGRRALKLAEMNFH